MIDTLHHALIFLGEPLMKIGGTRVTLGKLLVLCLIALFARVLTTALERGLRELARRNHHAVLSESSVYTLSRILRYVIWTIAVLTGLNYAGINLSNIALIGGAVGVGIGFGLQNIFSNFVSGIVLLLEQTLKVGDYVDLASGVVGRVSEINVRYTRVTTNDSVDIIVPNSEFINGRVTNWTFGDQTRRIHVPFGVAYGTDKDLVREAGLAAARKIDGIVETPGREPEVWLVGFGDSSLNFELVLWVGPRLATAPTRTQALFLWELETELGLRGIEIPFPQRDLHIRSGTLRVQAVAADETPAA